ncbi:MAG: hypothetical protein H7099_13460 [Gemmatimonadaceae bacterium]|nr:hypothetical protein [Gemmatimonadaceae bacterium]
MIHPRRFIVVAALTVSAAACATDPTEGPGTPPEGVLRPTLAIAANPRPIPAPQAADFVAALDSSLAVGAKGIVQTYTWRELEPDSARLDVQRVIDDFRYSRSRGLQIFLGIQVINTVKREMPADIAALAWTDPRVQRRFDRLLDALQPILGDVTYFSIGNEVADYLRTRSEWPAYTTFVGQAVASLHRRVPGIKVGATMEYSGAAINTTAARALIAVSDVAIYTLYPFLLDSFNVAPATITGVLFDNMIVIAGGKPVVLQELGYPASSVNRSSELAQAAFFTDAIGQWRARGSTAMPFVSLFLLHDFTPQQCSDFGVYYNLPNQPQFIEFLCSLGLRKADGSPRPSWDAVRTATTWLRTP